MDLSTVDWSGWPPALVWSLVVIVVVCRILPDVIAPSTRPKTCLQPSTGGTSSPAS